MANKMKDRNISQPGEEAFVGKETKPAGKEREERKVSHLQ